MHPRCVLGPVLLCSLSACGVNGDMRGARRAGEGHSKVGGAVVSTVDGYPITQGEVKSLADRAGMTPGEALERLQAERLLMIEAEARGYASDQEVSEVGEKALVQALLDAEAQSVEVTEEELRRAYEDAGERFIKPEQRESVHVLVRLEREPSEERVAAARALAEELRARLETAGDRAAFATAQGGKQERGFSIVGETLPPVSRGATFAKPFLDALFAAEGVGVIPRVVRTQFGWHAIVVTAIEPAQTVPFAAARETLEKELLVGERQRRVEAMIERLERKARVEVVPDVREQLSSLELF